MPVLLAQGLELLLYGMGTVVAFLALLVLATRLMSRGVLSWFPETETAAVARPRQDAGAGAPASDPSPELLTAIAAAVHLHRQRRGRPQQGRQAVR